MDYRIDEALVAIESNFAQTPNLDELARAANLSVSRLRHLFKQEVGISINQHIKRLRLQRAKTLLEETNLRIKEVCVAVGGGDISHFVSDFRKTFGFYPAEYRVNFRSLSRFRK